MWYYVLEALIGVTVPLASITLITIIATVIYNIRKYSWICSKSSGREAKTERSSSGNARSEYDEVSSNPPNISTREFKNTYANLPAASSADTAGTENSGYESLEMHPQNHQYESLATA